MPLTFLLYRCPKCGHDPLQGQKDEAACPACGLAFSRGGEGGSIRVMDPSGLTEEVPGYLLAAAVQEWTEKRLSEGPLDGGIIHSARVIVRQSGEEAPVHWGGRLLGFAEAMGGGMEGRLSLSFDALSLEPASRTQSGSRKGGETGLPNNKTWPLLEIRAVQTSSSTLQFSPASGGLVEFKFPEDSPFRWENLLRGALRRVYREAGMGKIVEFQPRIVTE